MVNRPCEDGKKVETTPIANFDFLGSIQIECRYYQAQVISPRLFNHDDSITNPYVTWANQSTTVTNPSTLSNTTTAIKKEN